MFNIKHYELSACVFLDVLTFRWMLVSCKILPFSEDSKRQCYVIIELPSMYQLLFISILLFIDLIIYWLFCGNLNVDHRFFLPNCRISPFSSFIIPIFLYIPNYFSAYFKTVTMLSLISIHFNFTIGVYGYILSILLGWNARVLWKTKETVPVSSLLLITGSTPSRPKGRSLLGRVFCLFILSHLHTNRRELKMLTQYKSAWRFYHSLNTQK